MKREGGRERRHDMLMYPISWQRKDEHEYVSLLESHIKAGGYYFSYSYDLTLSLQRQSELTAESLAQPLWKRVYIHIGMKESGNAYTIVRRMIASFGTDSYRTSSLMMLHKTYVRHSYRTLGIDSNFT